MRRPVARLALATLLAASVAGAQEGRDSIPLPEHPRPDFARAEWLNLNGSWRFRFDAAEEGERAGRQGAPLASPRRILVPFSWGAPLSGVPDSGSYGELIRVAIPDESLDAAAKLGEVVIRLEVSDALPGGLAIYGSKFGRYPVDPTVLFILNDRTEVARPR